MKALSALGILVLAGVTTAQYEIPWFTIDGGGGVSEAGPYRLSGTIGQPDAGPTMTGGPYSLTGGFWAGVDTGGPACQGDIDGDGDADFDDLGILLGAYEASGAGDIDGDGDTDFDDLGLLLGAFGQPC